MRRIVLLALVACGGPAAPVVVDVRGTPTSEPPLVIPPAPPAAEVIPGKVEVIEPSASPRDPRFAARPPRSRALILSQAQALERRVASAPDRAVAHRQLAELYSELAFTSDGAEAARSRERAIEHYSAIKNDHPTYARIDEVFYYLALSHELSGHTTDARLNYYEVIKRFPATTPWVPLSYFAFGEMFFIEAAADPSKYDLALQAYNEALKYPPSTNTVYADALLRIGEIHLAKSNDARARETFARLRSEAPEHPVLDRIPPGF
jgi:tetratricopeptide (TPR) repeat protein